MRKNWFFIGIAMLMAVLALGAVACDGDEDGAPTDTPALELPTDTPEADETPEATEPAETPSPEAGSETRAILFPVGDSAVSGDATLAPSDGGTQVEVSVSGGLEPGSHASHIHTGTCDSPGAPETTLSEVEADASGAGDASTTIADRPIEDFEDGNHYVAVHNLAGAVVTCGDIP